MTCISITRDDGLVFTYRVTGTSIVDWNKSGIDRHASGFNLVLATCYPFDAITRGSERYLVSCGAGEIVSTDPVRRARSFSPARQSVGGSVAAGIILPASFASDDRSSRSSFMRMASARLSMEVTGSEKEPSPPITQSTK